MGEFIYIVVMFFLLIPFALYSDSKKEKRKANPTKYSDDSITNTIKNMDLDELTKRSFFDDVNR